MMFQIKQKVFSLCDVTTRVTPPYSSQGEEHHVTDPRGSCATGRELQGGQIILLFKCCKIIFLRICFLGQIRKHFGNGVSYFTVNYALFVETV